MKEPFLYYQVKNHKNADPSRFDTSAPEGFNKKTAALLLAESKLRLADYQERLYAGRERALLIIFQAMDAAGKDSAVKHVMSGMNPQGTTVRSFKQPSAVEYDHDFLWRHVLALPERGQIGIHNRSHYESVLVCKVHPELVLKENLPGIKTTGDVNKAFWKARYAQIRNFEQHLHENGTTVLKFFLNVSPEVQKERLLERIEDPTKNWKFAAGDIEERRHWSDYMKAYRAALAETSTPDCPWYMIPADKKWFARLAISYILEETLKKMDPRFPVLPESDQAGLASSRNALLSEK
ncbi:polyphosphate--nucleotide phosphotransferase [Pedobacter yulinensis]|uniref:Polyphosphate--nucleotide phosphotransferase n=1 Tax=Pedobacter yulinensis TaxID=2126353 RepID=A0A2T3HKN1_9SPHI|nr:polyphosphate kinase 2 family protein [Pedobacter yulinensis]PST82986.1 polyphosphate--nucleotide phosphotransferase [Pedobacter yulinensis]